MATSAGRRHCSAARTQVAAATDTSSKIRRWPRPAPRNVTFQKRFILLVTVPPPSLGSPVEPGKSRACAGGASPSARSHECCPHTSSEPSKKKESRKKSLCANEQKNDSLSLP